VCSAGITLCQFIQLPPWSLYCQRFAYQIEEVIAYLLNQKSANSSLPVSALLIYIWLLTSMVAFCDPLSLYLFTIKSTLNQVLNFHDTFF